MAATIDKENLINTAMELADNGIAVFPVSQRKNPAWSKKDADEQFGNGKYGLHMASKNPDRVELLFQHRGAAGIGMPTGKVNSVTVIDVDCGKGKKSRDEALSWLEAHREKLRGTTVVRTKSGGLHYYCQYTPEITSAGNVWAQGVDCRNDGGYVVIPPFMGYKYERQIDPEDWIVPPPVPVERTIAPKEVTGGETPEHVKKLIKIMNDAKGDDQGWHTAARNLTAHLVGAGWEDAEILRLAVQWTKGGYTNRNTFEELCVMIAGARRKWKSDKAPKTTDQERIDQMGALFTRSSLAAQKYFRTWCEKHMAEESRK